MEERKDYEIINVEARIPKIIDVIIPNAIGHGGSMDLSNYYDKQEVDSKVQAVTPDLSSYATKAEVEAKVSTVTGQKGDNKAQLVHKVQRANRLDLATLHLTKSPN